MPRFSYSAYDGSGRLRLGEVEAPALAAVLDRLRDQGLFPVETGEVSALRYHNYLQILSEVEDVNYWERHREF